MKDVGGLVIIILSVMAMSFIAGTDTELVEWLFSLFTK